MPTSCTSFRRVCLAPRCDAILCSCGSALTLSFSFSLLQAGMQRCAFSPLDAYPQQEMSARRPAEASSVPFPDRPEARRTHSGSTTPYTAPKRRALSPASDPSQHQPDQVQNSATAAHRQMRPPRPHAPSAQSSHPSHLHREVLPVASRTTVPSSSDDVMDLVYADLDVETLLAASQGGSQRSNRS